MLCYVTLLILGMCAKIQCLEWVSDSNGGTPAYAFPGGYDKHGRTLYICMGSVYGRSCVGKVSSYLRSCKMPWGDREHTDYYYQVLTQTPWADYRLSWSTKESWGNVPNGAVRGGSGEYVGRYKYWDEALVPGKVVPGHKSFFYTYEGTEKYANWDYEVLVEKDRPILGYELTDVIYDFSRAQYIISPDVRHVGTSQRVTNDSPHEVTSSVSLKIKKTTTRSWSEMSQLGIEAGFKLTARVGVPSIAEVSREFHVTLKYTYSYTYGETDTHSVETSHIVSVHLGPNSSASVTMLAKEIRITIPYSGTLTCIFKDGGRYERRRVTGTFRDIHMMSYESKIVGDVSS